MHFTGADYDGGEGSVGLPPQRPLSAEPTTTSAHRHDGGHPAGSSIGTADTDATIPRKPRPARPTTSAWKATTDRPPVQQIPRTVNRPGVSGDSIDWEGWSHG